MFSIMKNRLTNGNRNNTAEIKAESDVCVTSFNALKIVEKLPNKNIFFIPDNNLGRYVAEQLPEKKFYSVAHRQFCPNMKRIQLSAVLHALETLEPKVELEEEIRKRAELPLQRMLELAK